MCFSRRSFGVKEEFISNTNAASDLLQLPEYQAVKTDLIAKGRPWEWILKS